MADTDTTLGILLTMEDKASPRMRNFGNTLTSNRAALRELASGVTYLGSTFLGLGVALSHSNDQLTKNIGQTAMMVGGILTAVGSSVQFISAVGRMIDALKKLQMAQILTQALSGPTGWATLGIGLGVAAGATAGVMAYNKNLEKTTSPTVNLHTTVKLNERILGESSQKNIVLDSHRNTTSGVR